MTLRPKVLVIAEAANPEWVSVPLVGWSLVNALRGVADVHLVTQVRNRDAISRAGLVEGVDFTAINSETVAGPLWKLAEVLSMGTGKGWTTKTAVESLSYFYFERLVWKRFGAAVNAGEYDAVHRVTPLSPTINSPIAVRCAAAGIPFVIGPLNGGVPWPKGFNAERNREREWLSYVRGAYKLFPGRKSMLKAATAILTGSRHTASEVPAKYQDKCIYLPENAVDPARFNLVSAQKIDGPLRGCFIGRLVPYKGPDILLEAASGLLQSGQLILDFIGDGPMMPSLRQLVAELGVENAVTFHGWQEHTQVQSIAVQSNLLTFPSIREFGGGVVLEAMALGVVPVIVDYAGPGELVGPHNGYKVSIGTRDRIIADYRTCLEGIVANPSDLPTLAQNSIDRVNRYFTWDARAGQVLQIYNWLRDPSQDKLNFFP